MKILLLSFLIIASSSAQVASEGGPTKNDQQEEIQCDMADGRSKFLEIEFMKNMPDGHNEDSFLEFLSFLGSKEVPSNPLIKSYAVSPFIQCECPDDVLLEIAQIWDFQFSKKTSCKQFIKRVKYIPLLKRVIVKKGLNYQDYRSYSRTSDH